MTLLIPWLVFPLVLAAVSLGCGLLLEQIARISLPPPLLLPVGFATMSVAVQFAHMSDATAELATPLAVVLAVAGFGLSLPPRRRRSGAWWIAGGVGVFATFAAPVVASGRATFAGFIKLDDTAMYLAMLDRAMHFGYNVTGLGPSTYEAALSSLYTTGYPLGSVIPLGVGAELVGQDPAWVWQPYLTFLAVLMAFGLYQLASGLVQSRALRALVAFVGAQAALIYGYALWGGIKELATAAIIVLVAALLPATLRAKTSLLATLPLAVASAAMLGVLSIGGAAWIALPLLGALLLALRLSGLRGTLRLAAFFLVATGVLTLPTLVVSSTRLANSSAYTSASEYGNLIRKLNPLQVFGIWPNGDFRLPPSSLDVTYVLVGLVALALALAFVFAWRQRAWEVILAGAAVACACAVYVGDGSPWIGAKALASASPIVLGIALTAVAAVFESGRRFEATVAAAFIIGGVLWSNALQYQSVDLAPSAQLRELATIGQRFAGQGPALMTEYEPYGARHFLRTLDTEGASELRIHYIYLRTGQVAPTGSSPDIDEIQLSAVLYYRTLILPRSGVESRPPSIYRLVWSGRYYQVWQRGNQPSPILEHLSLGSRLQPAAVPRCSEVLGLARFAAANDGMLATVERPPAIVIEPSGAIGPPTSYGQYGEDPDVVYLTKAASFSLPFTVSSPGTYGVWIGGTFRSELKASVDGRPVGSARDELTWPGNFLEFGAARLRRGRHVLQLRYSGPDLDPGSAGTPLFGLGPFVIAEGTENRPVIHVQPSDARSLCGKSLDWIEALRG